MASRPQVSQALSDPNLLLFDADDQETTTADITTHLAALNLPSSSLPAFPHPTLSPSSSKLSLRGPPSPTGITIDMTGGSVKAYSTSPVGYHTGQQSFGQAAGDDLEGDVARARKERLARRTQSSGSTINNSDSGAASARANIQALAARGGGAGMSSDGSTPSLASFMGGGAKPPRLHRAGTGPTEEEHEETQRLEREMAATKQRWGKQPESTGPPAGGMSLASLLKGGGLNKSSSSGPSSPTKPSIANRWQPAQAEPIKSKSAPAPMMTFGTSDNTFSQPAITPPVLSPSTFTGPSRSRSPSPAGRSHKAISIRPASPHKPLPSPSLKDDKPQPSSPVRSGSAPAPSSPGRAFPFSSINLASKSTPPTPMSSASTPQPRSLATIFGSTATGPRLNSQAPQHEAEEGPAHARPKGAGGVAMPGMVAAGSVRARAESLNSGKAASAPPTKVPVAAAPLPEAPPLVEAKVVSRSPPPIDEYNDEYSPPLHQDSSPLLPDSPESLRSARPLSAVFSPQVPSSPESLRSSNMSVNPSLTNSISRLQGSNIVADRLKWGEEKKAAASPSSSTPSSPVVGGGARPTHAKRNSVMERWGRDMPIVSGSGESSPRASPKVGAGAWTPPIAVAAAKPIAERWSEKKDEAEPSPQGSPALVHVNKGRARPPKSTPRGSAAAGPALSTAGPTISASASPDVAEPTSSASPSASASATTKMATPPTIAVQQSTPDMSSEPAESPALKPAVGRWNGAPIGVKEVVKASPWSQPASSPTDEQVAPKHTRGVALPGMSAAKAPPAVAPAPIDTPPEAPKGQSTTMDPVEEHRRRAQEEAQKAGRVGIGIGIFQRPETTGTPDATISQLSQAETSAPVEHSDPFPRFQDPFRSSTPQQSASANESPVDPRKSAGSPWAKPSKHTSYQGPSSSASIRSGVSATRAQSLQNPESPSSVRGAIASWGTQAQSNASVMSSPTKESYGVKPRPESRSANPATPPDFRPSPPIQSQQAPSIALHEAPNTRVNQIAGSETASMMSRQTSGDSTFTDAPDGLTPRERQASIVANHRPDINRAVELAKSPVLSPRVPGDSIGLDVYSLTGGEADPIDHNHVFYQTEILAIVNRSTLMGGKEVAKLWIWVGNEAREFDDKINERARKIAQAYGAVPELVKYRFEPRELVEVFGDQITICRGTREEFNHLDTKLYTVQAHEDVVFVEEVELTSKNICSGYCSVFSLVGEVYAWYGVGSSELERESCADFADTLADGRHVTELKEGSETAYFWHGLDSTEYASAHYWRFRQSHPQKVAVVAIDSKASPLVSRNESLDLSTTSISLIDGGFAEHWVVVPAKARHQRADISIALEAADELAALWRERGFTFKQPYHVLLFPTLIPRDLPHLARQLDLTKLNAGERPSRMNVLTPDEARHQLL